MTTQETPKSLTPIEKEQPLVVFEGGFGYNNPKNTATLQTIKKFGRGVVDSLPDPKRSPDDSIFHLTEDGITRAVRLSRAFQEAHGENIETYF